MRFSLRLAFTPLIVFKYLKKDTVYLKAKSDFVYNFGKDTNMDIDNTSKVIFSLSSSDDYGSENVEELSEEWISR